MALGASAARADAPTADAFLSIPSRFGSRQLTASSRALGELCYGRALFPDGTVCNPAYLPEVAEGSLLIRLFLGNGYTALNTANQLVNQPITEQFLRDLFSGQNVTSFEANAGLVFTSRYFTASFSPYRVQYVSEIHNPNAPVAAVHAALEQSFAFGGGLPLSLIDARLTGFSFGTTLTLLKRKYVHGTFSSLQLVTETPSSLLPLQTETDFYAEPSLAWSNPRSRWKPHVSIAGTRLGYNGSTNDLYPRQPDLAAGLAIEPPVGGPGVWSIGLDIVDILHANDAGSRFRAGTSYRYGILEPMLGANADALTAGLQFRFQFIQASIVYEFVRSDLADNALGDNPFENKIATEIAIRL